VKRRKIKTNSPNAAKLLALFFRTILVLLDPGIQLVVMRYIWGGAAASSNVSEALMQ
jgi:hypothetical protein